MNYSVRLVTIERKAALAAAPGAPITLPTLPHGAA